MGNCVSHPIHFGNIDSTQVLPSAEVEAFNQVASPSSSISRSNFLAKPERYVALYDFDARSDKDLSFRIGDVLEILKPTEGKRWFYGRAQGYHAEGYIPSNCVAKVKSMDESLWYWGKLSRLEAERKLLQPQHREGTFLIRDSESKPGTLILSVRYHFEQVAQHRILKSKNGRFFITPFVTFRSLGELVEHYTRNSDGLMAKLRKACTMKVQPQTVGLSYSDDIWEMPKTSLELKRKIDQGQFGEVHMGLWNKKTSVAIKTVKSDSMNRKDFLAEAKRMKKLHHPNIIQMYGVSSQDEPFYIVTELLNNGSLLDYLRNGRILKKPVLVDICAQIARGMDYLRSQNYIHGYLAARNILMSYSSTVKIADFVQARLMKEDECEGPFSSDFPTKWIAPEAAKSNDFTTESDVWSFGILLTEVITYGEAPYPSMTGAEVQQLVQHGYRMSRPRNCPQRLYALILECWNEDPSRRPAFEFLHWQLDDFFYRTLKAMRERRNLKSGTIFSQSSISTPSK